MSPADGLPGSSGGFGSGGVDGVCFADSGVVNRLSLLSDAHSADLSHRALQRHYMLKVICPTQKQSQIHKK